MSFRRSIQRILAAVVGLSLLLAIGEFPIGVIALELLDNEHEVVIAVEHTDLHVRIAHETTAPLRPCSSLPSVETRNTSRMPHDAHGIHMPRFDHQRQIVAVLPEAPPLAPLFCDELHFAAAANAVADPVAPIAPGDEHSTPPDLQRTVILLI
jgi:hypothetical protein